MKTTVRKNPALGLAVMTADKAAAETGREVHSEIAVTEVIVVTARAAPTHRARDFAEIGRIAAQTETAFLPAKNARRFQPE